jgi:hypothetical protein
MHFYEDNRVELFDLRKDIGESRDLSAQLPELSESLLNELDIHLSSLDARLPEVNSAYDGVTEFDPTVRKSKGGERGNRKDKSSKVGKVRKRKTL